ncbi:MAG: outer membrane protein assembly factor BamE [Burkholderiales bacterium]
MLLAGCATDSNTRRFVPNIVTPYRMDIQQGNFVTPDMVQKLSAGQTRDQVRFILGTPLITDVFHVNRWDYVFRFSKGWNDPETRRLAVYFDRDGRLERWDTDIAAPATAAAKPAAEGAAAPAAAPAPTAPVAPAPPTAAAAAPPPAPASVPAPVATPRAAVETTQKPAAEAPAASVAPPEKPAAAPPKPLSSAVVASAPPPNPVLAAIEEWRDAWQARDVERYLALYAKDFKPAGTTRARWEAQRRDRLKRASAISLEISDVQVVFVAGRATGVFTQNFSSGSLRENGRKTLVWVNEGGRWRIVAESFEKR